MAVVSVSFDTVSKKMDCSIDGSAVANVYDIRMGRSYYSDKEDEYECSLMTVAEDKESKMRVITHIVASESADGRKAARANESPYAGFVQTVEVTPLWGARAFEQGVVTPDLQRAFSQYFAK